MAGIMDLLGLGAPGGNVFNITGASGEDMSQPAPQQVAPQQYAPQPHGIRKFLDSIGDALLVANDAPPIHRQRMQEEQENSALQGFLTDPKAALERLSTVNAPRAMQIYTQMFAKQADPETIQLMRAAGIDPSSDEGKQIISSHLNGGGGADPSSVREYQFAKGQGFGGSYMDFINQRGGPLVANNGDGTFTIVPRAMVPTGGAGAPVTATGPDGKKVQYDPATHSWKPIGGQTPTASGNFPGR